VEATERALVVEHLAHSRERLVLTVEDLSGKQRNFRPAEDRWSIADCIEHCAAYRMRCSLCRSRHDRASAKAKIS
jgi:hypothetical protein